MAKLKYKSAGRMCGPIDGFPFRCQRFNLLCWSAAPLNQVICRNLGPGAELAPGAEASPLLCLSSADLRCQVDAMEAFQNLVPHVIGVIIMNLMADEDLVFVFSCKGYAGPACSQPGFQL